MHKLLLNSAQVRKQIASLFSRQTRGRRRVVLVAYVGASAKRYLPDTKNVEIYCWPQPGGTNPDGLRELRNKGASIQFSDNLHMKLYWVRGKGAVITSANLSDNAMGEGGGRLHEMGVFVSAFGERILNSILRNISPRDATDKEIRGLQRKHDRGRRGHPGHRRTFKNWLDDNSLARWKFGWWENDGLRISSVAKSKARTEYGVVEFDDLDGIEVKRGQFRSGDWVLRFRLPRVASLDWLLVDYVVEVPRKERKVRNQAYPYQAIQTHSRPLRQAPFNCKEKRFVKAFRSAVKIFGREQIRSSSAVIPTRGFLKILKQEY